MPYGSVGLTSSSSRCVFGFAVAIALAVAGCQGANADFCCTSAASCEAAGVDEITPCESADRPICDERGDQGPRNACVASECDDTHACSTNRPICDQGACRLCVADTECDSEVCDEPTGRCVAPDAILYVASGGNDAGDCTSAAPCATLATALAHVTADRAVVRLRDGHYDESVAISGLTVELAGDGATLTAAVGDPALSIRAGADVAIEGLTIEASVTSSLVCAQSSIELRGVTVHSSQVTGIDAMSCTLSLTQVRLTDGNAALVATGSEFAIAQSVVRGNHGGGIDLSGGSFTITNTVIADNGSSSSNLGGVRIANADVSAMRVFAFNTVTGNDVSGIGPAGVQCLEMTSPPVFVSNIVHGNIDDDASTDACTWRASDVGGEPAGLGNVDVDPGFADADYHLRPDSPLVDQGEVVDGLDVDRDGDPRPSGEGPDVGADEVVP